VSVLSAAQLAVLATWTNTSTGKLARVGQASIPLAAPTQDDWQSLFGTLAESVEDLNTAITTDGNFADPVADIPALKAVAAADRQDKQMRVVESDGLGQRSIYVFDSASSATADDVAIVAPTAGSGRWFMLSALQASVVPCINNSGSPITKGQPLSIVGYVAATGRVQVAAAKVDGSQPPPVGAAFTALADGSSGLLLLRGSLTSLALNTSGATLNDPVYLAEDGTLSLTPVADTGAGSYAVGFVSVVSATGGVYFFPPVEVRAPGLVRGVATMGSAATTETVTVGAAYNFKRAQVSFAGDPGTASVLWAAPVTGGDLVIHVDAAPGADVDIMWSIIVEQ